MTIDHMDVTSPEPVVPTSTLPEHEHIWRLQGIDYSDGTTVREFGCERCPAVWFD